MSTTSIGSSPFPEGSSASAPSPYEPGRRLPDAADQPSWDDALLAWPRAHALQSHGWGAVQGGAGWRAHRLTVDVGGRVLPVLALSGDAGLPGLPPRLRVPKGPACAPDDTAAWRAAGAALVRLSAEIGAAVVEVEPNAWEEDLPALRRGVAAMPGGPWRPAPGREPQHTALVDLEGGWDGVLARMRPQGRRNVRLGERRGVVVATVSNAEAAERLAALCAATAARQGISLPGAAHMRRVVETMPSARIHLATVDGVAVAGALTVTFAGEAVYLYGGSVPLHRDRQPSAALHGQIMREAAAAGCRRYDLWGLPPDDDPDHPWHGLRQFKLSLGGVPATTAGAWSWRRRPVAARALTAASRARRLVRRVRLHHTLSGTEGIT